MINCFWVSGQYKGQGHGYNLLQSVIEDAKKQQKNGLVTVVGTKKNHFMSDTKWLLKHGFEEIERLPNGFSLLAMNNQAGNERTGTKFSHTSHYFFSFLQWKVCNYGFKRLYRI